MDFEDAIAMALEFVLETERRKKKQLEDALAQKQRERSMLARKKHHLLRRKAAEQKLFDDFMVFIGAIENNDRQMAQHFDENEMMNAVVAMLTSNGEENGGFSDDNERIDKELEKAQNLGHIQGTNSDGGEGSDDNN